MLAKFRTRFVIGPPVLGDQFIDRASPLAQTLQILSSGDGNLLISGVRRIGKTSLCLQLLERVSSLDGILAAYMSMEAEYSRSPAKFTQSVLLHALKATAARSFGKTYSQILVDLRGSGRLDKRYETFLTLFRLARQDSTDIAAESGKTVGVKAVGQALISAKESLKHSLSPFSVFEYLSLLDELIDFLHNDKVGRFVLFVDEANKLTLEANSSLIRENLSLFSLRGFQFCFVTTPEAEAEVADSTDLFHHRVSLGPFENSDEVAELIARNCTLEGKPSDPHEVFSEEAIEAIWSLSKGRPAAVQSFCQRSFEIALQREAARVETLDVIESIQ